MSGGAGLKSSGTGSFLIPDGPAVGTSVTSGGTNNTYGSWVELEDATAEALYLIGVAIKWTTNAATYVQAQTGVGAAGSESAVWTAYVAGASVNTTAGDYSPQWFPLLVPVAGARRIAVRTATATSSTAVLITLIAINQDNVEPV